MHTHRDFAFNTEVYAKARSATAPDDVTVSVPRLFFGYATGTNLMFPFAVGATTALFAERPTPEALDGGHPPRHPTIVTNVPTMMGKLLDTTRPPRRRQARPRLQLRAIPPLRGRGPAPLAPARFTEALPADVYDGIGSAEMFHIYCSNRPGDILPGSLGRVVDGYTLKILSSEATGPRRARAAGGETGVMWVRATASRSAISRTGQELEPPSTDTGAARAISSSSTRRGTLVQRPRRRPAQGGRHLGRAHRGGRVPALQHPAVSLAAVIGAEDEGLTKPKAFVVLRDEVGRRPEGQARPCSPASSRSTSRRASPSTSTRAGSSFTWTTSRRTIAARSTRRRSRSAKPAAKTRRGCEVQLPPWTARPTSPAAA
jgi:acyl-CoA synthetase (AMP-forming)/AMP-acid ligase II